jgi:hypothetical protein
MDNAFWVTAKHALPGKRQRNLTWFQGDLTSQLSACWHHSWQGTLLQQTTAGAQELVLALRCPLDSRCIHTLHCMPLQPHTMQLDWQDDLYHIAA